MIVPLARKSVIAGSHTNTAVTPKGYGGVFLCALFARSFLINRYTERKCSINIV
jgi:hypothetical protein